MLQHFLAAQAGSGVRLKDGTMDAYRPAAVDMLGPDVEWQNYTYGPDGLCLVRMEAKDEQVLADYAEQKGVLVAFPADLAEILKSSDQQAAIEGTCALYGVPCYWLTQGLEWDEILRRLFKTFTLAQRLRGESKLSLGQHLLKGGDLDTAFADLPIELQAGLSVAADTLGLEKAAFAESGLSLKEVLFEAGRTFGRDPWETDPPLPPGTITDDFERASLGSNWDNGPGGATDMVIVSSSDLGASTGGGDDNCCRWIANTWNNDQSSEITLSAYSTAAADDAWAEPCVRISSDGDRYIHGNSGKTGNQYSKIIRIDNGTTYTDLGARVDSIVLVAGDKAKITVVGTTLEAFKNVTSLGTRTDSTYASGSSGPGAYRSGTSANTVVLFEDWSGTGEVVSAVAPVFNRRAPMRANIRR